VISRGFVAPSTAPRARAVNFSGMQRRRWIVVGIDFSPAAAQALERAAELATEVGASIACVHAYLDPPGTPLRSDPSSSLRSRVAEAASLTRARFPEVHVECFARRGAAWEKLANVATELAAEMIVVGANGEHARPHDSFLGSVATRVAATSTRSVLIVPNRDADVATE
jgi:nucleotide-binding universal stress UspA family protein